MLRDFPSALPQEFIEARFRGLAEGFEEFTFTEEAVPAEFV